MAAFALEVFALAAFSLAAFSLAAFSFAAFSLAAFYLAGTGFLTGCPLSSAQIALVSRGKMTRAI